MGLDIKRIQSFEEWKKRKLLVLHMETRFLDVESCLRMSEVPFYALSCEDDKLEEKIKKLKTEISGLIITGSRKKHEDLPGVPEFVLDLDIPILGLCYGNEWLIQMLGGKIIECNPPMGEYSEVEAVFENSIIFQGIDISQKIIVTMAHNYMIGELPLGCKKIASTKLTPIAGFENAEKRLFGLQFHPEKGYLGEPIFSNFYDYCLGE